MLKVEMIRSSIKPLNFSDFFSLLFFKVVYFSHYRTCLFLLCIPLLCGAHKETVAEPVVTANVYPESSKNRKGVRDVLRKI